MPFHPYCWVVSSTFERVGHPLGLWWGFLLLIMVVSDLMKGFCSLALAFSPSQSSLDHSDWFGKGWGTLYRQNMHVAPDCSHTFWGIGFMILMLPTFIELG